MKKYSDCQSEFEGCIKKLTQTAAFIATCLSKFSVVEMAGVEPASERFDPRIYYERSQFIDLTLSRRNRQNLLRRFTQTRESSFASRRDAVGSMLTL